MPAYAILGTTGKTGGSILKLLLEDSNNTINAYVRSKPKLLSQFPNLEESKSVRIFAGALTDIDLIASCLSNVDCVFITIGENENTPGTRMVQDAAHAVVAALCQNRSVDSGNKAPKVLLLSSVSKNPVIFAQEPKIAQFVITTAMSNVYADLGLATDYLLLHKSWLNTTFIQPGGLVEDEQRGHRLSMEECGGGFVSYLDLAAGMIEVAQSDGYEGKGVSVVPTSKDIKFEWKAPRQVLRGLVWHFLPSLGWIGRRVGLF